MFTAVWFVVAAVILFGGLIYANHAYKHRNEKTPVDPGTPTGFVEDAESLAEHRRTS